MSKIGWMVVGTMAAGLLIGGLLWALTLPVEARPHYQGATDTPTATATATVTPLSWSYWIAFNNSPTPTRTGTPPTATATPTGTPPATPTTAPTATPRPWAILKVYGSGEGFPTYTPVPTAVASATPTLTPTGTPNADVVINEICPNPNGVDLNGDGVADSNDRAVELYSPETSNVSLADWKFVISDGTTFTYTLPLTSTIFAQSYKVLWGNNLATVVPITGTFTLDTSWGHQADQYTVAAAMTPGKCDARKPDGGTPTANTVQTLGRANPTP